MPKVIYLNEERQRTFTTGYGENAVLRHAMLLNPGRNIVDDDIHDAVAGHKEPVNKRTGKAPQNDFCRLVDEGVIVVHGDSVDITKMSVKDAIKTIKLEATAEGVEDLLTQENASAAPRQSVVDAATGYIKKIRDAETEKAEDERKRREGLPRQQDGGNVAQ